MVHSLIRPITPFCLQGLLPATSQIDLLEHVCSQNRLAVLKNLLAAGAYPHYEDDSGCTAFDHAILGNNQKSLELLLKAKNLNQNLLLDNMAAYEYDWSSNRWRPKQETNWSHLISSPSTPLNSPSKLSQKPAAVTSGWL
jgi:ankyrin repeat protein